MFVYVISFVSLVCLFCFFVCYVCLCMKYLIVYHTTLSI
ncbi:hypothetical protein [Staphylococcus phage PT1-1]